MKKIISLLLCFALILCIIPQVSATRYDFVSVKLDAGSGASTETAIVQDNELYLPADSYSEITRYTYDEDNLFYLIDGQSQDKAFKTIKVNTNNNTLLISSVKVIDLPDIIEADGQLYLPLSIMLPVLNADVAAIMDGVIYVSNNELSLGEILYDFNISDYTFNYASEFADNIWLGKLSYELPNYLLDSVTHFRLDRLDVIFKSGDYNDYLDIFTEYLLDDEIYLESMSETEPNLAGLMEIINSTQSINKNFKTVFEWGEEFNNNYFESAKDVFNYLDVYIPYANNLEEVVDAVNAGDFSMMDALEVVEFFFNYYYQVDDHREMLDAVYHVDNRVAWNDAERKAARQVYNIYGGNAADGLLRGVWDKLCESAVGIATTPIKMYEVTSKVSSVVLEAVLPHDAMQNAADISKLSLYEAAMYSARSNYYEYRNNLNTDNDVNNLRHSILMTLLSSRSCYSVMLNTAKGYQDSLLATDYSSLISYYEHEIDKINAMICLIYKVADNVEWDSYEHVEEHAKAVKDKCIEAKLLDNSIESNSQKGQNDGMQDNGVSASKYRYSFDAGTLVLRTENYSDVLRADLIDENDRKAFGFWPIENTDSRLLNNDVLFRVENRVQDGILTGEVIVRYDARGNATSLFETDGSSRLIVCENDCLYFYVYDSDDQMEYYYRLNSCFTDDFSVDCLADMPTADDLSDNYENALVKKGEWIYFLYTDDPDTQGDFLYSPDLWLYRLSEKTGQIERVDTVYDSLSSECREILALAEYNGLYILEGIDRQSSDLRSRIFYLYDFQENDCTLVCASGVSGSRLAVADNKLYHLHRDTDGDIYWAMSTSDQSSQCKVISDPLHSSLSHYADLTSLDLCGNFMIYSSYANNNYLGYCIDLSASAESKEIVSPYSNIISFYHDGIAYIYLNGAVLYTDSKHIGQWFDSGIRFSPKMNMLIKDGVFFTTLEDKVYFTTLDKSSWFSATPHEDLNEIYNSTLIDTDFSKSVSSESPIFNPEAVRATPDELIGAYTPTSLLGDIYDNSYCSLNLFNNGQYDIVFTPKVDSTNYARYNTGGLYKYMAAVIGVSTLSDFSASGRLRFFADDKLVYETPTLTCQSEPIEIFIDVENADCVTVEAISMEESSSTVAAPVAHIVLDDISFHNVDHPLYLRFLHGKENSELEKWNNTTKEQDLLSMTSEEIKNQIFAPAYDVYYNFTGAKFAGAISEEKTILVGGKPYYKILDGRFTKYDTFMNYASVFFSKGLLDHFLELESVLNWNGDLYQFNPGYGGTYDPGYPIDYYIESNTDERIVYCRCSKYPKDPWTDKTPEQMTDEDYNAFCTYYVMELIDDHWVFTEWEQYK